MANFDLTNLAVKMICPNNVVKTDDTDLPSVLAVSYTHLRAHET